MPNSKFSIQTRSHNVDQMGKDYYDLLIIGGGITGAGAARDAASRGMKVALIEANDFASGTSSRSSKLIHGGIRYLENLEFKLVFEALSERQRLYEIAPHLVHPLRFLLPLYEDGRVGMFKMGLGMWLYDALSLFDAEPHERLDSKEALRHAPLLRAQGLAGAFVYSDAYMDDDRLVIETLRSAHEMGARLASYVKATGVEITEGKVRAVRVRDEVSKREFAIRARHVISSVGPWTDQVGAEFFPQWKKILRATKGIHVTLDRNRLPIREAVVLAADAEKRIIFAIPRNEMIIIGTTDTNYGGDPAAVRTEVEDVNYLLKIVGHYFPGAQLTRDDLIGSYAGVRPLIQDDAETESGTSREHKIFTNTFGVTFVAGGKYTTYRHMAEQVVNESLAHVSMEDRIRFRKSDTLSPLNPLASQSQLTRARAHVDEWSRRAGMSKVDVTYLAERHGMEAEELITTAQHERLESVWLAEASHAIEKTMCFHLEDFWLRRVRLFLARADHGFGELEAVSRYFAEKLDWNEARRLDEIKKLKTVISTELAWKDKLAPFS